METFIFIYYNGTDQSSIEKSIFSYLVLWCLYTSSDWTIQSLSIANQERFGYLLKFWLDLLGGAIVAKLEFASRAKLGLHLSQTATEKLKIDQWASIDQIIQQNWGRRWNLGIR